VDAHDQADAYYQQIVAVTERFKDEFDMTYAQLIGALEMHKMELFCEAMCVPMDEDDDEDKFRDGEDK
tara:strand:+ start:307 stop:510 length:204 start_codon:yes stop_codon:yes gene_type:complete